MILPVGTLLQGGKYRIVRFISSGGFGCTYEAEHVMLEERMAIKEFFVRDFCNRDASSHHISVGIHSKKELVEKLKGKFIAEARALCKLHHPGIVSVSDVFEENGTAYYVMEYIEGTSLHGLIQEQGRLPEKETLDYIRQVCDALRYVHNKNRLHLDIKPGNIMIDKEGKATLIDFGASKHYDSETGENTSTLMGGKYPRLCTTRIDGAIVYLLYPLGRHLCPRSYPLQSSHRHNATQCQPAGKWWRNSGTPPSYHQCRNPSSRNPSYDTQ